MAISEEDLQNTLVAVLVAEADPAEALPTGTEPGDELDEDAEGGSEVWVDSVSSVADDAAHLEQGRGAAVGRHGVSS